MKYFHFILTYFSTSCRFWNKHVVTRRPFKPFSLIIYRVFRKNCVFFTIHCNTSLASISVRDLQSSQRNASVQSLLVANFREFLKKNTIFTEHPVLWGGRGYTTSQLQPDGWRQSSFQEQLATKLPFILKHPAGHFTHIHSIIPSIDPDALPCLLECSPLLYRPGYSV